jgi:monofunctional glycosyltransferase
MATRKTTRKKTEPRAYAPRSLLRLALRWLLRGIAVAGAILLALVLFYSVVNPGQTPYMRAEARRLGGLTHEWVDAEAIAPVVLRSVVAAEDANFCLHWGFDMVAIRAALEAGGNRGASTLSQQVVKNVFLWQGRSWPRKALEAIMTPMVEMVWSKRRILEVYLNVAEFGEGVFGIKAAAARSFRVEPDQVTAVQAARLAAVLPDPKGRDAGNPSAFVRRRAAAVMDGAETILRDGRAGCFAP